MKFRRKVCANLWTIVEKRREKQRPTRTRERAPAGKASGASLERVIKEVHADAAHAVAEGREGFNFLGNFQAKLKLYSFAEFASGRKIGAVPRGMFMVSTGSDSAELSMASANCRGTPLMRRAAKQRSIVTRGSLGAGTNENSTRGQYSVNGN
jgi:hypothetical protein